MNLKLIKTTMFIFNRIKRHREQKVNEEILKHGLILFGFNVALLLLFTLGFMAISLLAAMLEISGILLAFVPLAVMFIFSAISAVTWYRFGQILGKHFKKKKFLNSSLVVLISILPLLVILIFISNFFSKTENGFDEVLAILFLGNLLLAVLAAIFELLVVNLGVMTPKR